MESVYKPFLSNELFWERYSLGICTMRSFRIRIPVCTSISVQARSRSTLARGHFGLQDRENVFDYKFEYL